MGRCKYGDPTCPCQDGDVCHYEGNNPMNVPPEYVRSALRETRQAALQEAAEVAKKHEGSAARKRRARGQLLNKIEPREAQIEIVAEERGEDMAACMIAQGIKALPTDTT